MESEDFKLIKENTHGDIFNENSKESWIMRMNNKALAVSILVPTVLFTLLSAGMAVHQLKRDMDVTASIFLAQVDHVTTIARKATFITARMAGQPCEIILEKITANGAFTPYIRSTGLIQDNILICSSVTGSHEQSVSAVYGTRIYSDKDDIRISSIVGTSSVPGHAAIIYATSAGNRMTAFSIVDARYFTDLMNSLDDDNHAALHLRFSEGPIISGQEIISPRVTAFITEYRSDYSQAHLEIQTPLLSLYRYILRNLVFLGPLSLLLTLTTFYLWRRWQARKMSLADEIRKGIARGEFSVHYQPVCETASGRCTGVEALMRWHPENDKAISPAVFIRAAEEEGIIISLTQHLFNLIADDVRDWKVSPHFHLGVNISASHLMSKTFMNDVLQLRESLGQSFYLVLEITERSFVEDTGVASEKLNQLRQKGCQVAVDDFGTGYCSLGLLQSLPVDCLKIDKTFIDTLATNADTPVLDTIIGLSKRLGLTTIAEGVSTSHQLDYLTENNVPYVQGFFYARPMPGADFYQWYIEKNV